MSKYRKHLDWRNNNTFSYINSQHGLTNVAITPAGLTEEVLSNMYVNNVSEYYGIKWDSEGHYLALSADVNRGYNCHLWSDLTGTWTPLRTGYNYHSAVWNPLNVYSHILAIVDYKSVVCIDLYNAETGHLLHTLRHTDSGGLVPDVYLTFSPWFC